MGHNVVDAIIHVDAIFDGDELELLCLLVLKDNGESHLRIMFEMFLRMDQSTKK
jgi:hypothetical protein